MVLMPVAVHRAASHLLAHLGVAKFQYQLAMAYYMGKYGEQNPTKAARWCRRAAEQDWTPAQTLLANFHVAGFGVPQDREQVFYWNQRAAEHGDASGQSALAWCYYHSVGTAPNPELAFKWWLEAAVQGLPVAQHAVADCLFTGEGTPRDLDMAAQWCQLALKNGASEARELLERINAQAQAKPGFTPAAP
jgi:TPR repeat protein